MGKAFLSILLVLHSGTKKLGNFFLRSHSGPQSYSCY